MNRATFFNKNNTNGFFGNYTKQYEYKFTTYHIL